MNKSTIITLLITLTAVPVYAQEKGAKKIDSLQLIIGTVNSYDLNGDNKVTKSEYERKTGKFNFGALDLNNDGALSVGEFSVQKGIEKKQLKDPSFKPNAHKSSKKAHQIDRQMKPSKSDRTSNGKADHSGNRGGKSSGGNRGGKSGGKGGKK